MERPAAEPLFVTPVSYGADMKTFTSPTTSPITTPVTIAADAANVRIACGSHDSAIDAALRTLTSAGIGFEVLFETDPTGMAA